MINDFLTKFLSKNPIMDEYGLKYNHTFSEEILKIKDNYSVSQLSNKVLIRCSGEGLEDFLNSQFTNDIKKLNKEKILLCGYCNPKGRLISVFYIFQLDKDYYLYTTLDSKDLLLKKLNMYKMALKIEFMPLNNILIGISNINLNQKIPFDYLKENKVIKLENSIIFMPYDNYAIISTNPEEFNKNLYIDNLSLLGYKSSDFFDIDHHTPFITSSFIETYTPQMLSLDILDGVSFEKGCYPGQEIVARTHYLGEAKKSLFKFYINSNADLDTSKKIHNEERKVAGDILNIIKIDESNYFCLGVLRKEFSSKKLYVDPDSLVANVKGVLRK